MIRGPIPPGRTAGIRVYAHRSPVATLALITSLPAASILPAEIKGYPTAQYWLAGIVTAVCFQISLAAHEIAQGFLYSTPLRGPALTSLLGESGDREVHLLPKDATQGV